MGRDSSVRDQVLILPTPSSPLNLSSAKWESKEMKLYPIFKVSPLLPSQIFNVQQIDFFSIFPPAMQMFRQFPAASSVKSQRVHSISNNEHQTELDHLLNLHFSDE